MKVDYSRDTFLPALVSKWAVDSPRSAALVTAQETITYADLTIRSSRLASWLQSIGVGPDVLVAICLPQSVSLLVGALAVWKAGGAYIPLDPECPAERLAWMLNDSRPVAVLTRATIAKRLSAGNWYTFRFDTDWNKLASDSGRLVGCDSQPDHLAYVIYTSGSTGRPKGVEITRANLLNLLLWHRQSFTVTSDDRASQIANPSFDASVWEVWPYLANGAAVHLPSQRVRSDPELLRDWFVACGITIAFVPTPLAERMMTLEWPRETSLRVLLTGGDTLCSYPPPDLPFTVVNNYGPTECTVVATSGQVLPGGNRNVLPTIGWPISNVQVHILDSRLHHVPPGVTGEICIGGAGVGRGYLNAPEMTAERFVPDFINAGSATRLYKTGDLARCLPDGQIAFVGRLDDQIKIRGFRIEPNEIVAALAMHPQISTSIVVSREDAAGPKRLVAYVVLKDGTGPTDADLRDFLNARLPDYMIPSAFVGLESLPLSANGKVDRTALPAPDASNKLHSYRHVAPRTPIERRIADLLAPLLGVQTVSVGDNFFLLGGHSLLGTQLIARLREAFSVDLSLRALFEYPTVEALAAEVERLVDVALDAMSEEEAERLLKDTVGN